MDSRRHGRGAALAALLVLSCLSRPAAAQLPQVFLDVADAWIPSQISSYWVVTEPEVQVPVATSAPVGAGGGGVVYTIGPPIEIDKVVLSAGATSASIPVSMAGSGEAAYPGWDFTTKFMDIDGPWNLELGVPNRLGLLRAEETGARGLNECLYCFLLAIGRSFEIPYFFEIGGCGAGRGFGPIQTLRRYRDEVLAATTEGQFYVQQYVQYSTDMMRAAAADPSFFARFANAQDDWVLAIDALVDGNGASAVITQEMQDELLSLLQTFEDRGTPELAAAIQLERTRLGLDSIAGLTMTEFQTVVETFGGPTPVEPSSWGRIKAWHRDE